jgi:imidazoleglycerol-phosphate dehydratase
MSRQASISRKTNETQIEVFIDLDYAPSSNVKQKIEISTGIGFLDHVSQLHFLRNIASYNSQMYTALAKHAGICLTMTCKGDLWIDDHHTADMLHYF